MAHWTVTSNNATEVVTYEDGQGAGITVSTEYSEGIYGVVTSDDNPPQFVDGGYGVDMSNCEGSNIVSCDLDELSDGSSTDIEVHGIDDEDLAAEMQEEIESMGPDWFDEQEDFYEDDVKVWFGYPIEIMDETGNIVGMWTEDGFEPTAGMNETLGRMRELAGINEISDELADRTADARHSAVKSADRSDRDAMMGTFDKFSKNQRLQHSRDIRQQKAGIKGQDPRSAEYQNAEPGRKNFGDSCNPRGKKLDELSKGTLGSYVKKASRDASEWSNMRGETNPNSFANDPKTQHLRNKAKHFGDKAEKRHQGIDRATDRLVKEEPVNELSKGTLGSYVKKASADRGRLGNRAGTAGEAGRYDDEYNAVRKGHQRQHGIDAATDRLMKEDALSKSHKAMIKECDQFFTKGIKKC